MDYVKIDGKAYDVIVTSIEETFNILYSENTGRTLSEKNRMILDPLGTFIGHVVTFKRKNGFEKEYDELYDYFCQPRYNGVMLNIVHDQETMEYEAYVSQGGRKLKKIDVSNNKVLWEEMKINFVPMEARLIP